MALQDILDAITAQIDQQITEARSAHQKELTELREQSERTLAKKKQEVAQQKEERKQQMLSKAQTHAEMQKRNAILSKKQELLDRTYNSVTEKLGALPDDKAEKLLRLCLKGISEKGVIHPTDKHVALLKKIAPSEQFEIGSSIKGAGGFLFVSKKQEHDCTFEHLVAHVLRPKTEVELSQQLFA